MAKSEPTAPSIIPKPVVKLCVDRISLRCQTHLLNSLIVFNALVQFLQLGFIEANLGAHLSILRENQVADSFAELAVVEIFTILAVFSSVLSGLSSVLYRSKKFCFLLSLIASVCSAISFLQLYKLTSYSKWDFLHVEVHLLGLTGCESEANI